MFAGSREHVLAYPACRSPLGWATLGRRADLVVVRSLMDHDRLVSARERDGCRWCPGHWGATEN